MPVDGAAHPTLDLNGFFDPIFELAALQSVVPVHDLVVSVCSNLLWLI